MHTVILLAAALACGLLVPPTSAQSCNVTVVAGSTPTFATVVNGPPLSSTFAGISDLAKLPDGSILVVDPSASCIRKYVPGGFVSTFSGKCGHNGNQGGATGSDVRYNTPWGIHVSPSGRIFVSDQGSKSIRLLNGDGGAAVFCTEFFGFPQGLFEDPDTMDLYVAESTGGGNDAIRLCPASGGTATLWKSIPNATPFGLHIDRHGTLYVVALDQHQILTIDRTTKALSVFCGTGAFGNSNGACTSAQFNTPVGITSDLAGTLYVTDLGNHQVKAIANGEVSLVAGTTLGKAEGDCTQEAKLDAPTGIVDNDGTLFVGDLSNAVIFKIVTTHDPAAYAVCDVLAAKCVQLAAECATIRIGGFINVADDCDTAAALCTDVESQCIDKAATCPLV